MSAHVIEVTPARKTSNDPIRWTMSYKNLNKTAGPPDYVPIDIERDKSDQVFVIIINDSANLGVKFPPTIEEALWIQQDDKPQSAVIEPTSQIRQASRVDDSILVFVDKNSGSSKLLKYQLNFVDSGGTPVTPIDPDIRNGGGKTGQIGPMAKAFAAGAILAVALTVLWFNQLGPNF